MTYIPKFRVWDKENKEWAEDFSLAQDGELLHFGISFFNEEDKENFNISFFSGIKDKNGKEIYEGDIVKEDNKKSSLIKFDESSYGLWNKKDGFEPIIFFVYEDLEIIGNIHENPELLEEQK